MKTQLTLSQKQTLKVINLIGIMMFALLSFNPTYAQTNSTPTKEVISNERTIKGLVSTEDGALPGVNIVLQGTRTGVNTDSNGEFTFPVKLKTGDVLIFSYLGFENQQVTIKDDTTFIKLVLTEDLVEMIGALDSAKPYKSKRKKN
ncbi:carboxypeptidase-like regulatory domain-containing protein [Winogradskyella sp. PG-2]|uniref:carboxypeptidase-like regulatory domain-containing protein n=1 Tax=Winogradskyella sp. PG-2 TaxID=754409 RepID=UPI0004585DCB|nr:carboxypeptidase-like regulatory domain-containing protein [Winogradskyella sp. PG-2]BAO76029.1 putative outer membrane protein [Winogradskyella sp. PG-2]